MKKLYMSVLLALVLLLTLAASALGAKTYGGHTYDAKEPYCYYNGSDQTRVYTGATIIGADPRIFTYNKRLMVTYDGVNWYEMGTTQTYQAPGGSVNTHWWHGLPHIRTGTYLYMTQIKLSHQSWAEADRSAGKFIPGSCF